MGVSLTGLEGQGEAVAEAYQLFSAQYSVYLFERKKTLKEGYRVEDMAEDISRAMELLHLDSAYVYGVSQGGMIAQVLAIRYPEKVKKLVLCSTMSRPTEIMKRVGKTWLELAGKQDVVALNRNFLGCVFRGFSGECKESASISGKGRKCRGLLPFLYSGESSSEF